MPEYFESLEQPAAADDMMNTEPTMDEKEPNMKAEEADVEGEGEDAGEGETAEMEEFGNYGASFSVMEFVKRLLKYLVEGLVVAIAASTIPKKKLDIQEVGVIALSAAATFALLDLFAPTISYAARQGAGFGVGANLVGFPRF
jgi:hypothetical protein